MSYHLCARQIGQCVGLGRGIQEYHLCARNANCKKMDREKVEKVVSKIKKREKNKQVERIGNFLYEAQSIPANLEFMASNIYDYHSLMAEANKPRIRKKTKEFWLEKARKAKEKVNLKSAWMKKNFPNADINDPNLVRDIRRAERNIRNRKEELQDRKYKRNNRTYTIRKMIDEYNKDKAKPKANKGNKKKETVRDYIKEYEKAYNQKIKELGVKRIETPKYCNNPDNKKNRSNCETLLINTINRLNLYNDGVIPDKSKDFWNKHLAKLKKIKNK